MIKTFAAVLASVALIGCTPKKITPPANDIETVTKFVPYPACPAPNVRAKISLPIDFVTDKTSDNDTASAYVKSIAILKAEISALSTELLTYQKFNIDALKDEQRIRLETK